MESTSGTEAVALPEPEDRAGIRILVAEDETTLRNTCVSVLRMHGYDVTSAADGQQALELIRGNDYDIMLVDLYIAEVPGSELLKAAMERRPETIFIAMTGNPSVRSNLELLKAGAWDYLPKPFSGTQLEILIGRSAYAVLRRRQLAGHDAMDLPRGMTERPYAEARDAVLRQFERAYLRALMQRADGDLSRAARTAVMDPARLARLLEEHGLQRPGILRAET